MPRPWRFCVRAGSLRTTNPGRPVAQGKDRRTALTRTSFAKMPDIGRCQLCCRGRAPRTLRIGDRHGPVPQYAIGHFHTCSSPSGLVNSERSPIRTSCRRREYAGSEGVWKPFPQRQGDCCLAKCHFDAWFLYHEGQIDLTVAGEFEAEHVASLWLPTEERNRVFEDHADPLMAFGEALAGAQQKGHSRPAIVVHPHPGGYVGFGAGVVRNALDVRVALDARPRRPNG